MSMRKLELVATSKIEACTHEALFLIMKTILGPFTSESIYGLPPVLLRGATGTTIFTPYEGEVFSVRNNAGTGDYGPTIILKHQLVGVEFYSLYGHLSLDSIQNVKQGDFFATGTPLCSLGNYPENGEWAPHLHFQLITNLDDFNDGDYPAVCTEADKAKFAEYCPNPNLMLKIPCLD